MGDIEGRVEAASELAAEAAELLLELHLDGRRARGKIFDQQLTVAQAAVLWVLDDAVPRPMSALAKLLQCDNSNVTGLVDKLEARGMLVREQSTQDRRIKLLRLTPEGRAFKERARARFVAEGSAWISALDADDQQALVAILRRGRDRFRDAAAEQL